MCYIPRSTNLINSVWNKEELPQQWRICIAESIYKKIDKTECSNFRVISFLFCSAFICRVRLHTLAAFIFWT